MGNGMKAQTARDAKYGVEWLKSLEARATVPTMKQKARE
jgi:hypothetical protein